MPQTPAFRTGQNAHQAHRALKISVAIMDQAQHGAVLWFGEIMCRKLYRKLGYGSMRQYATEALGFSQTRAGDFVRLARKLDELPGVKKEMAAGRLGYTKAREITKVADLHNEEQWLQEAQKMSRRELEATVMQAQKDVVQLRKTNPEQRELMPRPVPTTPPAAATVRVSFDLTPTQHARYQSLLNKIGHRGDKAELLLDMMEALLGADQNAPRGTPGPHYQIHIHECPTCTQMTVPTPSGEVELTKSEAEAARCDAKVNHPGQRNTTTIPPRVRREVLARDRHRCRRRGCDHTGFLHLHHILPRHDGGTHDPENLVTLCPACHRLWHERGGDLPSLLTAVPAAAG